MAPHRLLVTRVAIIQLFEAYHRQAGLSMRCSSQVCRSIINDHSRFIQPSVTRLPQVLAQHSSLCHRHCSERSSEQPPGTGFRGLPLAQWPAPAQPGGPAHPGSWGEEEKAQRKRSRGDSGGARAGPQPAFQTQVRQPEGSRHFRIGCALADSSFVYSLTI